MSERALVAGGRWGDEMQYEGSDMGAEPYTNTNRTGNHSLQGRISVFDPSANDSLRRGEERGMIVRTHPGSRRMESVAVKLPGRTARRSASKILISIVAFVRPLQVAESVLAAVKVEGVEYDNC